MVNILFCGNHKVFDGMLTCALSILKRTDSSEPFTFYIFTMDVSHLRGDYLPVLDEQLQLFYEVIRKYNEDAYCSPYTLTRLFADKVDILPEKLLYLDADILFNRDIHLLYDTVLEGYEYAAARDHYGKYLVSPNYINAGVLLFNLKRIRETGLLEKARALIKTKKLPFADQSAIIRSTQRKKMLPQRFNDQKFLHSHTVVRHFSKRLFWMPYPHTANIKQWQVNEIHRVFRYHAFDDILQEYLCLKKELEQ